MEQWSWSSSQACPEVLSLVLILVKPEENGFDVTRTQKQKLVSVHSARRNLIIIVLQLQPESLTKGAPGLQLCRGSVHPHLLSFLLPQGFHLVWTRVQGNDLSL